MTHLEKFVTLYKEFGIDCKINEVENPDGDGCCFYIVLCNNSFSYNDAKNKEAGTKSNKFVGYNGFFTEIHFDQDCNFIRQGFLE